MIFALSLMLVPLTAQAKPPNIVFILADDLGWSELGCYGNQFNETPNLDAIANSGVRFTQAYAAAPVCSPYRAALLTGKHPARIGVLDYLRPNSSNGLSTSHETLPELLRERGYRTGMIGKWHLTGYAHHGAEHETKPVDHGFDWDFAREVKGVGNGANFWPYVFRSQPIRWLDIPDRRLGEHEFLVDRMNREAVDFIERNQNRPFFLYLSHYATHSIVHGKSNLVDKYIRKHRPGKSTRTKCYLCEDQGHEGDPLHHWAGDHNPHLAAMLESIDDGVGMIRRKLDELNLADNTIIIFTSDNGGETNVTSNAPLRGGKSQLYEGGVRVPLIIAGPEVALGGVSDQPTMNVDFLPTLLDAAGADHDGRLTDSLDGQSIRAAWREPAKEQPPRTFYWHYPLDRPHFLGGRSAGAVREGDWKLIEFFDANEVELYQLRDDPSESRNLAATEPRRVEQLRQRLRAWRERIGARQPSAPLLVEPRQMIFADHFAPNQLSDRWWFNDDWTTSDETLVRKSTGNDTTRIFVQKPEYDDAMIRFDFQFRSAKQIRLVTGGDGSYNAVVHVHRDHFFLQTPADKSVPYFSERHGECAFAFEPDRWYTMTVEFLGDRVVAHLDAAHLVAAQHPIVNRTRRYLALQVDAGEAAFDNFQLFRAGRTKDLSANFRKISIRANQHPVALPAEEREKIVRTNTHSRLHRTDSNYQELVSAVDRLDEEGQERFPSALMTHKQFQKKLQKLREEARKKNPEYRVAVQATHRAKQAMDRYLLAKAPGADQLQGGARNRTLVRLRREAEGDAEYLRLAKAKAEADKALLDAFPELHVSNQAISEQKQEARRALETQAEFRDFIQRRATAWRKQQQYLEAKLP